MDLDAAGLPPPGAPAAAAPARARVLAPARPRAARGADPRLRRLPRRHAGLRADTTRPTARRPWPGAAEWGRQHGLGPVVTWFETEWYKLHPAKVGGQPTGTNVLRRRARPRSSCPRASSTCPRRPPSRRRPPTRCPARASGTSSAPDAPARAPAALRGLRAARPGAHELRRRRRVDGPDGAARPALLGVVHPGRSACPSGTPRRSPPVASRTLVAAFNAGFRMQDANGGYYTDGRTLAPAAPRRGVGRHLPGRHDDRRRLGARAVTMSNQVASVRQNLDLIVDQRQGRRRTGQPEHAQVGQDARRRLQRLALGHGRDE